MVQLTPGQAAETPVLVLVRACRAVHSPTRVADPVGTAALHLPAAARDGGSRSIRISAAEDARS